MKNQINYIVIYSFQITLENVSNLLENRLEFEKK